MEPIHKPDWMGTHIEACGPGCWSVAIHGAAPACDAGGSAGAVDAPEAVYRHQLRPVLLTGAVAMDRIFTPGGGASPTGAVVTQLVTHAPKGHDGDR